MRVSARGTPIPRRTLFAAAALVACSGGADVDPLPSDAGADAKPQSAYAFETWFATLYHVPDDWIAESRVRARAFPEAVAASTADVLCLQGVYLESDRRAIAEGAKKTFPHVVELPSNDDTPVDDPRALDGSTPPPYDAPPCVGRETQLDTLARCAETNCADASAPPRISSRACGVTTCAAERSALLDVPRCRECADSLLISGVPIREAMSRCATKREPFAFGGHHGLMLLSRHPLDSAARKLFPSTGSRWGALRATAHLPNGANVDLFCSQVGWARATDPYTGRYGAADRGWRTEQSLHIKQLTEWVKTSPRAVLMVETQSSMAFSEKETVLVEPYEPAGLVQLASELTEALASGSAPACTYCFSNPLVREYARHWSSRVYVRGIERGAVLDNYRTMTGAVVSVTTASGAWLTPLSAYYGHRAVIRIDP